MENPWTTQDVQQVLEMLGEIRSRAEDIQSSQHAICEWIARQEKITRKKNHEGEKRWT